MDNTNFENEIAEAIEKLSNTIEKKIETDKNIAEILRHLNTTLKKVFAEIKHDNKDEEKEHS